MLYRWFLQRNVGRVGAFLLGWFERGTPNGITFDDDAESPRSRAYDYGRNIGGC